jgi:hypothetical protein
MAERLERYRATPRLGLRAEGILDRCRALLDIARNGLLRLGATDGAALLVPVVQLLAEKRSYADVIAAEYRRVQGDRTRLLEFLRL